MKLWDLSLMISYFLNVVCNVWEWTQVRAFDMGMATWSSKSCAPINFCSSLQDFGSAAP